MLGTRTTKIFRDITSRRTRTALVSLSVFVGVLGVVLLTTLGTLITRQLEKDLVPSELAMLRIFVETTPNVVVDDNAVLQKLRTYPGLTRVEGEAVYEFEWKHPGDPNFQTGLLYAYTEPFGQVRLEPVRLIKGRYPIAGQQEIAIEERMARAQHLNLGDTLDVHYNGNGDHTLKIVGFVFQPYLYIGGGDGTTSAYATYADARQIVGFNGLSSIYVRFTDFTTAHQQSRAFRTWLMSETPYRINFYLISDPQENVFLISIRQFSRVLLILSIVAMIVASFLVTTVISTIMAEQRQQIGAMKALGATRWDILFIYLGIALCYGLLGTVPAIVFGAVLGQQAALAAAPVANTVLENSTPPLSAILLGAGLGIGVPILAAFVPVFQGSRVTILEAMTDQGITDTYGKGFFPKLVRFLPLRVSEVQALNSILRHKSRLLLTVLTLTFAVAAFMGVFAVFRILHGVVGSIQSTLNYQVSVNPGNINVTDLMQTLFVDEQIREIQPGVAIQLQAEHDNTDISTPVPGEIRAESAAGEIPLSTPALQSQPKTSKLYVTGIDAATDLPDIPLTDGTGWTNNPQRKGIVITAKMAQDFDKKVGDKFHLIGPEGGADFEVIGITDFPLETAFMEWHQLSSFVGVIRDAPVPNAYWEQLQLDMPDKNSLVSGPLWAVGIDEQVGGYLAPPFDTSKPGVIISQALADAGGFKQGDSITLRPHDTSLLSNLVDNLSVTYPILAIVNVSQANLRAVASNLPSDVQKEDPPLVVAMYWSQLADLVHLDYGTISPDTFYIDLANPQTVMTSLNPSYVPPKAAYRNQVAFEDHIAQVILSLGLVMGFTSVLMAIVGGIGLLTVMSIGVYERQREIGVMRSVGASSRLILEQFLMEGLLIGLFAWGVGVPLSLALSRLLVDAVPFNDVLVFKYSLLAPLFGLIGILAVTGAATLYPAFAAARKTVAEILHYQ